MRGFLSSIRVQLSARLATGARAVMAALDHGRSRHSHVVVETPDRQAGFALVGGWKARHLFQRLYLGTSERVPVRVVFHQTATADDCRGLARRYGMVVFCGDSAPAALAAELLSIPVLVDMEMPTPVVFEGPGSHWSAGAKSDIRRVRRGRFQYDIQRGDAWVPEFYARMFRPTLIGRHGARAYSESQPRIARLARVAGGELLRVLQDGKWVAGSMNQSTAAGYRLVKLAWAEGSDAVLRSGAVCAMYWFNFKRAAVLGHSHVLFGTVSPFLEDGVLRYKSKWGGRLSADGRHFGEFRLLLDLSHPMCRRFLHAHSLIARGAGRDFIVFSGGTPQTVDVAPELLRGIARWYTWRDRPSPEPDVSADEVPHPLRAWLAVRSLT